MTADESFFARWARRKRAAATNARDEPNLDRARGGASADTAADSLRAGEGQPLVDPESLPPIETLGAGSDIRPFLAQGVPTDLTRAALRRAWSVDPAIRDFIGLSENSWDFNAPGGVPGFGRLMMEHARRLLAEVSKEAEALGPPDPAAKRLARGRAPAPAGQSQGTPGSDQTEPSPDVVRHEEEQCEPRRSLPQRRHGGALPD